MLVDKIKFAITSRSVLHKVVLATMAVIPNPITMRKARDKRAYNRFRRYREIVPEHIPTPVFVKIGANDGIMDDPCSDILLTDERWKGLLVEPLPHCLERLEVTFRDASRFTLEPVAVGADAGESTFYYVDRRAYDAIPGLAPELDGLGSFKENHIAKILNSPYFEQWKEQLQPFIMKCDVRVQTLAEILQRNRIRDVHLLQIAASGSVNCLICRSFGVQTPPQLSTMRTKSRRCREFPAGQSRPRRCPNTGRFHPEP